ncbi:hypothetical protein EON65_44095 [archaeon]|nr:MAG: hypothetical protein EON65_44095 [archaeon]
MVIVYLKDVYFSGMKRNFAYSPWHIIQEVRLVMDMDIFMERLFAHHSSYTIHKTLYIIHHTPHNAHHVPYTIFHIPLSIHHSTQLSRTQPPSTITPLTLTILIIQMEVNGTFTYQADSVTPLEDGGDHSGGARLPAKSIEVELSPVGNAVNKGKRGENFTV